MELLLHWYPGHMAKATRELKARLRLVDAVLEVIDARFPESSRHPAPFAAERPLTRVILLGRADLADPELTKAWIRHFHGQGLPAVAADLRRTNWVTQVRRLLAPKPGLAQSPLPARPAPGGGVSGRRSVRAMVVGLPNVGKSTAINALVGRAKAGTGARAGVTRRVQWLAAGDGLELLDSPGLLWPEAIRGQRALWLAAAGLVPDDAFDAQAVAGLFLTELARCCPERLAARYRLELPATARPVAEDDHDDQPTSILAAVALRTGCRLPGGRLDLDRAAAIVLQDFRAGRLGRMTLEEPPGG